MLRLTTCLLAHHNHEQLETALKSVASISDEIVVGTSKNDWQVQEACRRNGAGLLRVDLGDNFAAAKNQITAAAKNQWVLWLEPWETVVSGADLIRAASQGQTGSHVVQVVQNKLVTKEVRLFHRSAKLSFINPVYETIEAPSAGFLDAVILSKATAANPDKERLVRKWLADKPTDPASHYYHSCLLLEQRRFDDFLRVAQHYLFLSPQGLSAVMTMYHMAVVRLYAKQEIRRTAIDMAACLAVNPLMAEFWCLLGDANYKAGRFENARVMYENAKTLGAQRLKSDPWPVDLMKYGPYPDKMIGACQKSQESTRLLRPLA